MSEYEFPPSVDNLLQKQLATGEYGSTKEVLIAALESLEPQNTDWEAVKESLDTLDAGEAGVSIDEAFDETTC